MTDLRRTRPIAWDSRKSICPGQRANRLVKTDQIREWDAVNDELVALAGPVGADAGLRPEPCGVRQR